MKNIISIDKSIILACDVSLEKFEEIVKQTADIEKVGGYKIPATSGFKGWVNWVDTARTYTSKPLIYDHQKAATDIPDTAKKFMDCLSAADFDAVILFPRVNDYEVQKAWIEAAFEQDLGVIVGGEMTHQKEYYLYEINKIYSTAIHLGVSDFVVPGNRPDDIKRIRESLEKREISPTFYAPGFGIQGGDITKSSKAAGERFHAIVGRGIYQANDIKKATLDLASKL